MKRQSNLNELFDEFATDDQKRHRSEIQYDGERRQRYEQQVVRSRFGKFAKGYSYPHLVGIG